MYRVWNEESSDSRKGMDSKSRRMQENIAEQAEDFERIKRLPQDNVFKQKKTQ